MTQKERQDIINDILNQLRSQRDRKQELQLKGSITVNPQVLASSPNQEFGPFRFNLRFQGAPALAFGQSLEDNTKVFVTIPYRTRWFISQGTVEGFYLGVYPVTDVPGGLDKHTITWIASGQASPYRAEHQSESWQSSYDNLLAPHLNVTPSEVQN